jgi:diguanylate cyclase (GGDEF)-like protein/PAS domain S-box-containing protein
VVNPDGWSTTTDHADQRIAAVMATLPDLVVLVGTDGRIVYASEAASRVLRRPAPFLVGQPVAGLVHPEDRRDFAELLFTARVPGLDPARPQELRLSHVNGSWVDVEVRATALDLGLDGPTTVLHLRDNRQRKAFEQTLRHQAMHDPLTNLANRTMFGDVLQQALARAQETPLRPHALLFVDLDGFKTINDSLGHATGDEVLAVIGERIRTRVRPGDTAARLGGDEFAVLLENSSERDATVMGERILEVIGQPFRLHGKDMFLSGSMGIALSEPHQTGEELLRNADVAMYEAKLAGKGRLQVFRAEMQEAALRRLEMEADLRRAIAAREFVLHYQPIVVLGTGEIAGAEALVRWRHPSRGLVPPAEFIPLLEDSGLILPVGAWILREACRQVAEWRARFPRTRACFRMSVNVSVSQIEDESFFREVATCLSEYDLAPGTVTLEITESLIMRDFADAVQRLQRLKTSGVRIAVDDFGTGYSSLRYLRYLPIDLLKIDRSFIEDVLAGPEASAVTLAVIKLARTFGMVTLAEGIEEPGQAAALLEMGAELGQGYHFARPMDAAAMGSFLARHLGQG